MQKRVPLRWGSLKHVRHRPHLLIESDDPALAISDFAIFRDAGFDVAFCTGPGQTPDGCPLRRGQPCDVAAGADVALHRLGSTSVVAELHRHHPDLPVVVVEEHPSHAILDADSALEERVLPTTSLSGQLRMLRRALWERRARNE
jgi:hypothetical protein